MKKEKIYLIPGLMTDERLWSRIKPLLEDKYELVHFPIPNSEDFDEINEHILNEINEEKINILGFSLGGYIASYFTLKNQHRVNRLFVVAVTPSATSPKEEIKRKEKVEAMKKEGFIPLGFEKAKSLVEEKNQSDLELISIIENMYNDLGRDTFITQMNSTFNRLDLFEDLNQLKLPVWFFVSLKDRLLNKESLSRLLEENINLNVITREGSSHNIPLEDPDTLAKLIYKWMETK
ncbi:alpha/beta hydrolase [Malaciobacter pacificus]|uniref:Alpha/beta hydrolase family protein n=1 Tax=Malaciobacter pacificus TaxID=1080223 RepID=A0A5C2HCZ2_9BACT|nr:alpha/beta hydrolase [Malaciobacter pacificus]QEP34704.1 alpha/beta hydrolase family protein [Malaciobacter pacificus]GGD48954.1 alpha/beta hydrolase [Malaciobacter pacificus]